MFHLLSKHFELLQKYSAACSIFNSLLGVSIPNETLFLVFDILLHLKSVFYSNEAIQQCCTFKWCTVWLVWSDCSLFLSRKSNRRAGWSFKTRRDWNKTGLQNTRRPPLTNPFCIWNEKCSTERKRRLEAIKIVKLLFSLRDNHTTEFSRTFTHTLSKVTE